jgi:hypothetical protein
LYQILISGHQMFLKCPGECPVFFLKAVYIAERDLNPESIPIPSMESKLNRIESISALFQPGSYLPIH